MSSQRRWIVGRAPDCNVIVNETAVSARHCTLSETPQGFVLEDLQSSNGTYVNGVRIAARTLVKPTDRITLGQTVPLPWPAPAPPCPRRPWRNLKSPLRRVRDASASAGHQTTKWCSTIRWCRPTMRRS